MTKREDNAWRQVVREAASLRTSFYWPLRLMSREKREAMWVLYAYCHAVDAIADDAISPQAAREALADGQKEQQHIERGTPRTRIGKAYQSLCTRYALPADYAQAMLDAVALDVAGQMRAPDHATLERYCYGVAGCVGLQTVRILGVGDGSADAFAVALGHALQRTNILRDVLEDIAMARLYLPREWLAEAKIEADCAALQRQPHILLPVLQKLGEETAAYYRAADAALPTQHAAKLVPALAMRNVYHALFMRMQAQGFAPQPRGVYRLASWQKLRHAARAYALAA